MRPFEPRAGSAVACPTQRIVEVPGLRDQRVELSGAPFADHRVAFIRRKNQVEHELDWEDEANEVGPSLR